MTQMTQMTRTSIPRAAKRESQKARQRRLLRPEGACKSRVTPVSAPRYDTGRGAAGRFHRSPHDTPPAQSRLLDRAHPDRLRAWQCLRSRGTRRPARGCSSCAPTRRRTASSASCRRASAITHCGSSTSTTSPTSATGCRRMHRLDNTLVYMLAHPSRDAAKASWAAFAADPEWKKVVTESQVNGKIVARWTRCFSIPRTSHRLSSPSGPRNPHDPTVVAALRWWLSRNVHSPGAERRSKFHWRRHLDRRQGRHGGPAQFEAGARTAWHSHDKGQLIYAEIGRCAPGCAASRSRNTRRRQRIHAAECRALARRDAEGTVGAGQHSIWRDHEVAEQDDG